MSSRASQFFDASTSLNGIICIYGRVINTVRSFTELSITYISKAKIVNTTLVPFHIVSLIGAPFEVLFLGKNLREMIKAPSHLKLLPLLKLLEGSGNILDYLHSSIWIAEQMGSTGIQALSAATVPLGAAALGLQALGIAIAVWRIHDINKQWTQVQKVLGNQPDLAEYKAAVNVMTKPPLTKKGIYRQKFFGILSDKQRVTIKDVYRKAKTDPDLQTRMDPMIKALKNYHFQKKSQNGISILLMIIGIVGVTLIAFAPTPLAPIAWGIVGSVGVLSLSLLAYSIYKDRSFNQTLLNALK